MVRRSLSWSLITALIITPAPGLAQSPKTAAAKKDRHALLIGVTVYENLPKTKHLAGPANDVLLMRKLLIEKFQFSPEQISILSEQQGSEHGKGFLPTRANIEREFKRTTLEEVLESNSKAARHCRGLVAPTISGKES